MVFPSLAHRLVAQNVSNRILKKQSSQFSVENLYLIGAKLASTE